MTENSIEYQYLDLLQDILDNGIEKETRNGKTISVFGRQLRHKMSERFPALTTKKFAFKTMVTELLWFLSGSTDIRFLWKSNCKIWDGDWYKSYCKSTLRPYSLKQMKEFALKEDNGFHDSIWSLGPIYGHSWRSWGKNEYPKYDKYNRDNTGIDQIQNSINLLKTDPNSRRNRVDAWHVGEIENQIVPPCHTDFQLYTRELSYKERYDTWFRNNYETGIEHNYNNTPDFDDSYYELTPKRAISLIFNMRSNDVPLGLPFNIASYGLLLEIIGKMVNMVPDDLITNLGDAHIYKNQIDGVKEQLTREPYILPKLKHLKTDNFYKTLSEDLSLIAHLDTTDFQLVNYQSHPKIKIPLSN